MAIGGDEYGNYYGNYYGSAESQVLCRAGGYVSEEQRKDGWPKQEGEVGLEDALVAYRKSVKKLEKANKHTKLGG